MQKINILCIGDIVGSAGRNVLSAHLKDLQREYNIHYTIANVENSAGGFGISKSIYNEFETLGIDAMTSGNHIFCQKDMLKKFNTVPKLLRPLNFPSNNPGIGMKVFTYNEHKIGIVNIIGRVFMSQHVLCPFETVMTAIEEIQKSTPIIIVDFHAEVTSEKQAMGAYLAKKVSAIYGTHTHVMTADNKILENHTGYITDIGMTGSENSILGMEKEAVLYRFLTQMHARFEPSKRPPFMINGICLTIDTETGKTLTIKKVLKQYLTL